MRKRSKYRPKPICHDNMGYVKQGMYIVDKVPHAGVTLKIKNHDALTNITQGKGTRKDLDILVGAFNIAEALALMKMGDDYRKEIQAGLSALHAVSTRFISGGNCTLKGEEMNAINLTMEIHDAQLDICTVKDMENAITYVDKVIRHGYARKIVAA
jgi:hypothetical protein